MSRIHHSLLFYSGIVLILSLFFAGCGEADGAGSSAESAGIEESAGAADDSAEPAAYAVGGNQGPAAERSSATDGGYEEVAGLYQDIYEEAVQTNTLRSLDTIRAIMERLAEYGISVTDSENQNRIDMANPEPLEEFCRNVEMGKDGEVTFFSIQEDGGFICFNLVSQEGSVQVNRNVLSWNNGIPRISYQSSHEAHAWIYTQDGYLFFEEEFPDGYDGAPGYTAIRLKPLDESLREANLLYFRPVGYGSNNLFLQDWDEAHFDVLRFDDLFTILYPYVYGSPSPYEKTVEESVYEVPAAVYETVLMNYFHIDQNTLRQNTLYLEDAGSYEYHTRPFSESASSPNNPYPEAVACEENDDGTLTYTVQAVWPAGHLSNAFSHQVTIRPLEDGSFEYVSNQMLPSENGRIPEWLLAE